MQNQKSTSDYYPFGSKMESRSWAATGLDYKFAFNGKEQDNEVSGEGNTIAFEARIYDSRLGRWMSTDPLQKKYPSLSPYTFVANSPILLMDPDGKKIINGMKAKVNAQRNNILKLETQRSITLDLYKKINGEDMNRRGVKKLDRELGIKSQYKELKKLEKASAQIDNMIHTFKTVNPNKFKLLNELQNINGTETNIVVRASLRSGQDGNSLTYAETIIIPVPLDNTQVVTSVVNSVISINLNNEGMDYGSFSNEMGDVDYYRTRVLNTTVEARTLWDETSNPDVVSNDEYKNNKAGAGYYSDVYEADRVKDLKSYLKNNKVKRMNRDKSSNSLKK